MVGAPMVVDSVPTVGEELLSGADTQLQRGVCAPSSGTRWTSYLSDVMWITRSAEGGFTVLYRTEAEALKPQNGDGPDGFDSRRFGPSGRSMWKFDSGPNDKDENYERARRRMRAGDEVSMS
eukprot:7127630-Prymnesium_polylepis.1